MKRLFVIGSSNTDFVFKVDRFPQNGETLISQQMNVTGGGKGANQARVAARVMTSLSKTNTHAVFFIGTFGEDPYSLRRREELSNDGVNLEYSTILPNREGGIASILIHEKTGENQITLYGGANNDFSVELAKKISNKILFSPDDTLLISMEIPLPTIGHFIEQALFARSKIILNPAPMKIDQNLVTVLQKRKIDFLIPNEIEFQDMIKKFDFSLNEKPLSQETIITQGKDKIRHYDQAGILTEFLPPQVQSINTVGAGDTFCGCFAALIHMAKSEIEIQNVIEKSMEMASLSTMAEVAVPPHHFFSKVFDGY